MYRLTVEATSTPSTESVALECERRPSKRPDPLPIESVNAGLSGRRFARVVSRVVDMDRQQSGNRMGDEESWDEIWVRSMVGFPCTWGLGGICERRKDISNSGTSEIEFGRGFTESPAFEWSICGVNIGISYLESLVAIC